ncbi:Dip2/Utp12 protein [Stylosanthes scabra]|uniref:Dip2/Utp12 protein n=1 Tax=Stylosanthes scabra TaxID=79078 RepID=A0ABU6T5C0_9FABA|nr:Dip2/Utp12 protein [Stylosanthes scabra]
MTKVPAQSGRVTHFGHIASVDVWFIVLFGLLLILSSYANIFTVNPNNTSSPPFSSASGACKGRCSTTGLQGMQLIESGGVQQILLPAHHSKRSSTGIYGEVAAQRDARKQVERNITDPTMFEEKEKRLEEMFEGDLDNAFKNKYVPKEEIPEEGVVALSGEKTQRPLLSIIERLDIEEAEKKTYC